MENNKTDTQELETASDETATGAPETSGMSATESAASPDSGDADERRRAARKSGREPENSPAALPLYNLVMKIPGPKNFAFRAFLLSFITTLMPMFGLMLYVALNVELTPEMIATVSIVMITALLGSISTVSY